MKRMILCLVMTLHFIETKAQDEIEYQIDDTVKFISKSISALESDWMSQELVKLNFEPCDVEYTQSYPDGNWKVWDPFLYKMDQKSLWVDYDQKVSEWYLRLYTINKQDTIEMTGSLSATRHVDEFRIYSNTKEPLMPIGWALKFAIENCKSRPRFKD